MTHQEFVEDSVYTLEPREAWLQRAAELIRPMFVTKAEKELPAVRVSVGWPVGRPKKTAVIGQCWAPSCADDGLSQVFVSPVIGDSLKVLEVLVHELVHAVNFRFGASGHGKEFRKVAVAVGLEGPMRGTTAGPVLAAELAVIVSVLGPFPHAALMLGPNSTPKQTTRMVKIACQNGCGQGSDVYTLRMTRKWLTAIGVPICPGCVSVMVEAS